MALSTSDKGLVAGAVIVTGTIVYLAWRAKNAAGDAFNALDRYLAGLWGPSAGEVGREGFVGATGGAQIGLVGGGNPVSGDPLNNAQEQAAMGQADEILGGGWL